MAPKYRASAIGVIVTTGKWSAHCPMRQPSPSMPSTSSSSTPDAIPSSPSSQIDFKAGKAITIGRKVDFYFLDLECFEIGRLLKNMGREKVCSLDVPTYPALVREFYNNVARGGGSLVSYVRGTQVHITYEILGNILEMPIIGMTTTHSSDRCEALSRMLGREVIEFEEIGANELSLELRLLHNICSRILFPKTGRFEFVSERDVAIMDCVLNEHLINLVGMMIEYMAEVGTKKRSILRYGIVLTLIFWSQRVDILDNEPQKKLRHTNYYNISTLHRMGFKKING